MFLLHTCLLSACHAENMPQAILNMFINTDPNELLDAHDDKNLFATKTDPRQALITMAEEYKEIEVIKEISSKGLRNRFEQVKFGVPRGHNFKKMAAPPSPSEQRERKRSHGDSRSEHSIQSNEPDSIRSGSVGRASTSAQEKRPIQMLRELKSPRQSSESSEDSSTQSIDITFSSPGYSGEQSSVSHQRSFQNFYGLLFSKTGQDERMRNEKIRTTSKQQKKKSSQDQIKTMLERGSLGDYSDSKTYESGTNPSIMNIGHSLFSQVGHHLSNVQMKSESPSSAKNVPSDKIHPHSEPLSSDEEVVTAPSITLEIVRTILSHHPHSSMIWVNDQPSSNRSLCPRYSRHICCLQTFCQESKGCLCRTDTNCQEETSGSEEIQTFVAAMPNKTDCDEGLCVPSEGDCPGESRVCQLVRKCKFRAMKCQCLVQVECRESNGGRRDTNDVRATNCDRTNVGRLPEVIDANFHKRKNRRDIAVAEKVRQRKNLYSPEDLIPIKMKEYNYDDHEDASEDERTHSIFDDKTPTNLLKEAEERTTNKLKFGQGVLLPSISSHKDTVQKKESSAEPEEKVQHDQMSKQRREPKSEFDPDKELGDDDCEVDREENISEEYETAEDMRSDGAFKGEEFDQSDDHERATNDPSTRGTNAMNAKETSGQGEAASQKESSEDSEADKHSDDKNSVKRCHKSSESDASRTGELAQELLLIGKAVDKRRVRLR